MGISYHFDHVGVREIAHIINSGFKGAQRDGFIFEQRCDRLADRLRSQKRFITLNVSEWKLYRQGAGFRNCEKGRCSQCVECKEGEHLPNAYEITIDELHYGPVDLNTFPGGWGSPPKGCKIAQGKGATFNAFLNAFEKVKGVPILIHPFLQPESFYYNIYSTTKSCFSTIGFFGSTILVPGSHSVYGYSFPYTLFDTSGPFNIWLRVNSDFYRCTNEIRRRYCDDINNVIAARVHLNFVINYNPFALYWKDNGIEKPVYLGPDAGLWLEDDWDFQKLNCNGPLNVNPEKIGAHWHMYGYVGVVIDIPIPNSSLGRDKRCKYTPDIADCYTPSVITYSRRGDYVGFSTSCNCAGFYPKSWYETPCNRSIATSQGASYSTNVRQVTIVPKCVNPRGLRYPYV